MNTLKIETVTLRYDGARGWPWILVYIGDRGEAHLAFPFRRDALGFAHRRGWRCAEPTTTQEDSVK